MRREPYDAVESDQVGISPAIAPGYLAGPLLGAFDQGRWPLQAACGYIHSDPVKHVHVSALASVKRVLVRFEAVGIVGVPIVTPTYGTLKDVEKSGGRIELSKGKSFFHGSFFRGHRKFVSKAGEYREVIFDKKGNVVDHQVFKGSFNLFSPTDYPKSHILVDVDPYVKHGN